MAKDLMDFGNDMNYFHLWNNNGFLVFVALVVFVLVVVVGDSSLVFDFEAVDEIDVDHENVDVTKRDDYFPSSFE